MCDDFAEVGAILLPGDPENLASEELDFEIIDGVKMFRLEEVNRLFTGFKINEFIVGFDDGQNFRKP